MKKRRKLQEEPVRRPPPPLPPNMWETSCRPLTLEEVVGAKNRKAGGAALQWLREWTPASPTKMIVFYGPPGTGKSSVASIVIAMAGYTPLELNSSDQRSRNILQGCITEASNNTDLSAFGMCKLQTLKRVILMEESNSLPSSQTISQLIQRSCMPLVVVCNDCKDPRIKNAKAQTTMVQFHRPDMQEIFDYVKLLAARKGVACSPPDLRRMIQSSGFDIRQIINTLQSFNGNTTRMATKDWTRGIGEAAARFFSPHLTIQEHLVDYNSEPSMLSLFIQENYAKVTRGRVNEMADSIESICWGDMVDLAMHTEGVSMHHEHAFLACIVPGCTMSCDPAVSVTFPSCLGKQSSMQRRRNMLTDMRTRTERTLGVTKYDLRMNFVPHMRAILSSRVGREHIDEFLDFARHYNLSREDVAAIMETFVLYPEHRSLLPPKLRNSLTVANRKQ